MSAHVKGERGEVTAFNYLAPHLVNLLSIKTASGRRRHYIRGDATTYTCQLRAFAAAVLRGAPVLTTPQDAVANMHVIDAVYRAAGLPVRGAPAAAARHS